MRNMFCIFGVGCLLTISANAEAGTVIYVDADATGPTHDGTSWCTAYVDLQQALDVATAGTTIRVANGTYRPSKRTNLADPRSVKFQLINGITMEGAYAGCSAPDPGHRDVTIHASVLSGDIGTPGDDADNAYQIVSAVGTDQSTSLDGFTLTLGSRGALYGGDSDIRRCTFERNVTFSFGGAVFDAGGRFIECVFAHNRAGIEGGAVYTGVRTPTFIDCAFLYNSSTFFGGAVSNAFNAGGGARFFNCSFYGNSAGLDGGALFLEGPAVVSGCVFSGNTADLGGAIAYADIPPLRPTVVITNSTFSGNLARFYSGTLFVGPENDVRLVNSIIWGNVALGEPDADGDNVFVFGPVSVSHSDSRYFSPGDGNIALDPLFVRPPNDGGDGWGVGENDDFGDLRLRPGSPCIDAGRNEDVPSDLTTDLDGNLRFVDDPATPDCPQPGADCGTPPIVDMGAYEFQGECPEGADCDDRNECTIGETCQSGVCTGGAPPDCPGGPCHVASCDPNGAEGNCDILTPVPEGTPCGDSSDTPCDNPDTCDSSGSCQANYEPVTTTCGDAEGACTNQDYCDGSGGCTDNGFKDTDTACGNSADTECDNPDHCSGTDGSCEPNYETAGTPCGDTSDTDCTNPDTCNGSGACQANNSPDGTSCDDSNECTANDTCSDGACVEWDYLWTGFFQPVDNALTYNRVKAGSAIPIKFSLGCDQGLEILESGYPKSGQVACNTASTGGIESTVTAGGSGLSYDPVANQYIYVWKTDKAWASTCRVLNVKLADGTSHYAYFTFFR